MLNIEQLKDRIAQGFLIVVALVITVGWITAFIMQPFTRLFTGVLIFVIALVWAIDRTLP